MCILLSVLIIVGTCLTKPERENIADLYIRYSCIPSFNFCFLGARYDETALIIHETKQHCGQWLLLSRNPS